VISADKRAKRGVFFIDSQPYTGWIDYDRDDLKKHEDRWIPWLEERLQMILIRPLDRILHRDSPDHGCGHGDGMSLALGLLTLVLCAVEALGALMCGGSNGNKAMFCKWIEKYMLDWNGLKGWLYGEARCGMAHALGIENGGIEVDLREKWKPMGSSFVMNHYMFYADFKEGAVKFFDELRRSSEHDDELWKNFKCRFESTFL
jgi:hypothetical protein